MGSLSFMIMFLALSELRFYSLSPTGNCGMRTMIEGVDHFPSFHLSRHWFLCI
ncbi:hypothetical protein RND81_08G098400 [Saponaria officinalis]|uniref:Uncharacterized protein n=1 Tax=Saponaria officinalis TaxID=3572 RepID=A0AAW1J5K0_SAPOF